jgi:hypothetical protein
MKRMAMPSESVLSGEALAEIKTVLGQALSHSVKELQRLYATQPKGFVLTRSRDVTRATPNSVCDQIVGVCGYSASETAIELCFVLEAVFLHEMKPSFSAKVSSSLALLDVRRKKLSNNLSQTFWPLLVACSPKDVINQLSRLANITTEIGQCRAWIRLALNEGLMENYVEAMLFDRSLISSMYKELAFLLDPELTFTMKSLLQGLSILTFKLTYDSQDLNVWPSDTLQLAGLEEVPKPPTVVQSSASIYDPMASFSTLGTALKSQEASEQHQPHTQKYKSKGDQRKRGKTTTTLPPDIFEQEKEQKERRTYSMLAASLAKYEDNESIEDEEALKGASKHDEGDNERPTISEETILEAEHPKETTLETAAPIPVTSSKQSLNEPVYDPRFRSFTDISDVSLSAQMHEDDLHVPPHLDTSETSVVGTPADSFGYLLKKHRRRYSQPTGGTVKKNIQPVMLEDFAGLSYDMVTPSQLSKSTGTAEQPGADAHNAEQLGYEVYGTELLEFLLMSLVQVIDSRDSSSPPSTPCAEPHQTLLTHISNEQGLDSQSFQCSDCSAPVGMIFGHAKVCSFDARYYCKECHLDEEVLIPSRIIHNWDFNKHKVCHTNKEYLDSIEEEPLFNLAKINSSLYGHVPELQEVKLLRHQLSALVPYVYTCQTRVWDEFGKKVWGREYLFENEDLYSIADFVQVQSHHLVTYLKKTVSSALKHVNRCKVCCQKGFICEICNNPKIIYPFEVHSTLQCRACQSVFHKSCKLNAECPKCARLNERRRRRQEEEIVDESSSPPKLAGDQ